MLSLIFPRKCVLCRKLLSREETDLCHNCRTHAPEVSHTKFKIPLVAHWQALWYYKDDVRRSIHRFKFGNARSYAQAYARLQAAKLQDLSFDVLSWVPTAPLRTLKRGYDQSALLAKALGKELGVPAIRTLRKVRNTPPQSGLADASHRRANILGAYRPVKRQNLAGKRILLVDDVITTGSTGSECAKTLQLAGAKEVYLAAVAAAPHDKNK